jgi:hypothetical protein
VRIAILGGGGVGVCAALEIARRGHCVDIYEQDPQPIMRASRVNEGKIHQGFLYAKDPSKRTARLMAEGALAFAACLSRWLDLADAPLEVSTPFVYAVHKESMVDIDDLRRHYAGCVSILHEMQASSGLRYLARDEPASFRELSRQELDSILDPTHFAGAFVTSERSVDPRGLAGRLRDAVVAESRITFIGNSLVVGVTRRKAGGFDVAFDNDGAQQAGPYDHVVNALWEGRLAIDRSMGLEPTQSWMFRHKFGNRVSVPLTPADLPSVTMVLGPFGDIVNFGRNGLYLSWYPFGMVDASFDLQPPPRWARLDPSSRFDVFDRSLRKWSSFCPKLKDINFSRGMVDPSSGVIFAWGDTDIGDPHSRLHDRYGIGVESIDGYHTVNSGKYTMVPYFGLTAAERVLGQERKAGIKRA